MSEKKISRHDQEMQELVKQQRQRDEQIRRERRLEIMRARQAPVLLPMRKGVAMPTVAPPAPAPAPPPPGSAFQPPQVAAFQLPAAVPGPAAAPLPQQPTAMDVDQGPLTDEQKNAQNLAQLKREVTTLQEANTGYYNTLTDKEAKIAADEEELKALRSELTAVKNECKNAKGDVQNYKGSLAKAEDAKKKAEADKAALERSANERYNELKEEHKQSTEATIRKRDEQLAAQKAIVDELRKKLAEQKSLTDGLHKNIDSLKTGSPEFHDPEGQDAAFQALTRAHADIEGMFKTFGTGLTLDDYLQQVGGLHREDSDVSLERKTSRTKRKSKGKQRATSLAEEMPESASEDDEAFEDDDDDDDDDDEAFAEEQDDTQRTLFIPRGTPPDDMRIPGAFGFSPVVSVESSPTDPSPRTTEVPAAAHEQPTRPAVADAQTQTTGVSSGIPMFDRMRYAFNRNREQRPAPNTLPATLIHPPMVPPSQSRPPQRLTHSPIRSVETVPTATQPWQPSFADFWQAMPKWAQLMFYILFMALMILVPSQMVDSANESMWYAANDRSRQRVADFNVFMGLSWLTRASIWINDSVGVQDVFLG